MKLFRNRKLAFINITTVAWPSFDTRLWIHSSFYTGPKILHALWKSGKLYNVSNYYWNLKYSLFMKLVRNRKLAFINIKNYRCWVWINKIIADKIFAVQLTIVRDILCCYLYEKFGIKIIDSKKFILGIPILKVFLAKIWMLL